MGGGIKVVKEGTERKVELLSYGNIPDYYHPLLNDNGKNTKKQKISVLSDYQVTGLLTSTIPFHLASSTEKKEANFNKLYKDNRRKALVAIGLTSEGMDNCQSLIGKLLKHPNVIQIAFQGQRSDTLAPLSEYPCTGIYGNNIKLNAAGNVVNVGYKRFFDSSSDIGIIDRLIIGQPLKYSAENNDTEIGALWIVTRSLKEKVMLINYNF